MIDQGMALQLIEPRQQICYKVAELSAIRDRFAERGKIPLSDLESINKALESILDGVKVLERLSVDYGNKA